MATCCSVLNSWSMNFVCNQVDSPRSWSFQAPSAGCRQTLGDGLAVPDNCFRYRQIGGSNVENFAPFGFPYSCRLAIVGNFCGQTKSCDCQISRTGRNGYSLFHRNFAPSPVVRYRSYEKTRFLLNHIHCSSESSSGGDNAETSVELPLFPLPLVLFPGAILPLQIFEFRYRIMMHTLLQTDLRFGVLYTDKGAGLAAVGCVGEVIKHERLVDDRFFMICKGQERFRVLDIVRTKPYLVARVEWLEDRPSDNQEDLEALANEVESYMKDVIRLSNRVNGKPEKAAPEDLRKKLFPTPFSFWVGSTFEGAPVEQQALLELEDTAQRLKREKETLRNTLNYLSAASAVKDAFPSSE